MAFKKEEIPLNLGQKVTLKVRNEVFNVQIRGFCRGQYIILDLPKIGSDYFRIVPQTGLQIHYTKDGLFVNFKSASILSFAQAISFLIIEYPCTVVKNALSTPNSSFKILKSGATAFAVFEPKDILLFVKSTFASFAPGT